MILADVRNTTKLFALYTLFDGYIYKIRFWGINM